MGLTVIFCGLVNAVGTISLNSALHKADGTPHKAEIQQWPLKFNLEGPQLFNFRTNKLSMSVSAWLRQQIIHLSDMPGGLNRSMQHYLAVYSLAFESPRSLAGVGLDGAR